MSDNTISLAHSIVGVSKGRPKDDFYPTPKEATIALLKRETFKGVIHEPACGDGAISKVLQRELHNKVISTDLYDRGFGVPGIDFLVNNFKDGKVDNIITNPPYSLGQAFVEKALRVTHEKIAMLMKIQFLEGARRYALLKNSPLKSVYVFSKRLTLTRNGEPRTGTGMICFAWYIWDMSYAGKPYIDWINI